VTPSTGRNGFCGVLERNNMAMAETTRFVTGAEVRPVRSQGPVRGHLFGTAIG
jgi:hypothetical protein